MARFRRSNHWMWQPRDLNGRFAKSGGGGGEDPLNEWFLRAAWWKKILFLLGVVVLVWVLLKTGLLLIFAIFGWLCILFGK